MQKDVIQRFANQPVKIVITGTQWNPRFALSGVILEVHDDSIIFRTADKTSAIDMRVILEVTPLTGGV